MDNGILYAAITIAVGLVAASIAYGIIRWLKKKAEATETQLDDIILMAVGTPLVIGIILLSGYVALTRYGLVPQSLGEFSSGPIINAISIILPAWVASVFLTNLLRTSRTV
ncbi:MAG: mechanosensitive ion channel family protein, partial [Methanoregula sp.]|nr:mechanosensitive ion channel family protein [Methanoregula sp.]